MEEINHKVLLADDDIDDCTFFKEALEELPLSCKLNNGKRWSRIDAVAFWGIN